LWAHHEADEQDKLHMMKNKNHMLHNHRHTTFPNQTHVRTDLVNILNMIAVFACWDHELDHELDCGNSHTHCDMGVDATWALATYRVGDDVLTSAASKAIHDNHHGNKLHNQNHCFAKTQLLNKLQLRNQNHNT